MLSSRKKASTAIFSSLISTGVYAAIKQQFAAAAAYLVPPTMRSAWPGLV
jgi:hypothetical protein